MSNSKLPLSPSPSKISKYPLSSSRATSSQLPSTSTRSGPVTILWDIENCPIPSDALAENVSGNIRSAIRSHPAVSSVTAFSAFGDFNGVPRRLRECCQKTGVKLVDVPNGRKDAADKAILVDMFLFALDNPPPGTIVLISGDVDFAPALHILGQRGYTIILVVPSNGSVSSALTSAGQYVWDWHSMATGQIVLPPKNDNPKNENPKNDNPKNENPKNDNPKNENPKNDNPKNCNPLGVTGKGSVQPVASMTIMDMTNQFDGGFSLEDEQNEQENEEEAIVYRGTDAREFCDRSAVYYDDASSQGQFGKSMGRTYSVPIALDEGPYEEPDREDQDKWWVRPGDLNGLKGQLVRLLENFGGMMPLVKVPPAYLRLYGRQLYMAEYGGSKLVHLFSRMKDAFQIIGTGMGKTVCLRKTCDASNIKKCAYTPVILKRGEKIVEKHTNSCYSDEVVFGEEKKAQMCFVGYEELTENLKLEMQEILVCFGYPLPLNEFEGYYQQRYKKKLEYCKFGVNGLEELVHKISDEVALIEDSQSNKFLVPNLVP